MPTYTYRCTKCGTEIEVVQAMSDPPLKRCRKCKGALRRTFHPVGIVLKGSGFHRTDYRSKPSSDGKAETSETKAGTKAEKKDSAKSEKKPASGSAS